MGETSIYDFYKLNVDAAFFTDGTGAAAAIICNTRGEAVAGHLIICSIRRQPKQLRFRKIWNPLKMQHVRISFFESDCLKVMQSCSGVNDIWSPYTAILADIFQKAFRIGLVSFVHFPRKAHKVAHNLARCTYNSPVPRYLRRDFLL